MTTALPKDTVNALVPHSLTEPLAGRAEGPLAGKSFMVKDLYAIAGRKVACGNPVWFEAAEPATATAPAVRRLLDAGASCVGITICDEFFYSLLGTNVHYGTPANPRAKGRVTGGSSCGSAAAVAGGLCDFALGSDTGGSVRVPASFCGLYGLRPTHGRIDAGGVTPMAPSYDTVGHLADAAALFRDVGRVLLEGASVPASIERVLVADDLFAVAETPVRAALEPVLDGLRAHLPSVETVTLVEGDIDYWRDIFRILQAADIQTTLLPFVASHEAGLGPGIKERFEMVARLKPEKIAAARPVRAQIAERLHAIVAPGTVVAMPAAPTLPPERGPDGQPQHEDFRRLTLQLTCLAGHAGLPQITVPAARAQGCPVGLSFLGWAGGDEALLDLAVRLEPALRATAAAT